MITLFISIIILFFGYIVYSKYIERVFGADSNRPTPALTLTDGVDYIPIAWWKAFLIQFLNIAGLGPIFGAVAGAMWGPAAYLWIIMGAVFAGAVHDYFSGMLSIKHNGLSITEIVGIYLGKTTKQIMRGFTVFLMVIVGAVFILGPAKILTGLIPDFAGMTFWIWIVFGYYILSTLLPINKVIGRIYPVFGFALVFMAVSLILALFTQGYHVPEFSADIFKNLHNQSEKFPIFPMLFITIACGAISGFHATQSPLMARCLKNEKMGRRVFYGAMITEAVVAMIWATISMSFFGGVLELNEIMVEQQGNAAWVVNESANVLLGKFGAFLAILGVVAAPITSGDTAFRSGRLIVADFLNLKQGPLKNRLYISIPLFTIGFLLTQVNFDVIWRYFAWSNQTLATIVLWAITVYLVKYKKNYWITFIPALFMTAVVSTYLFLAPEGFHLSPMISYLAGTVITFVSLILFIFYLQNEIKKKTVRNT